MTTIVRNFWTGVNIFFVISGFVLFRPYVSGVRHLIKKGDYMDFYLRRAWRLIPLLLFSTAILISINFASRGGRECIYQLANTVTGMFVFSKESFFPPPNGPLWSLGVELWYSLAFPLVAILLLRQKPVGMVIMFYAISLLTRLIGSQMFLTNWDSPLVNPLKDCLLGRIDDFVAGMVACLIYYRVPRKTWFSNPLLGLAGALALVGGDIIWDLVGLHLIPRWASAFANIPINLGSASLLLYALNAPASLWATFLRFGTLQACGIMCYSIYVWHFIIQHHLVTDLLNFYQIGVYLGFLAIIATMSWLLIECANPGEIKTRLKALFAP